MLERVQSHRHRWAPFGPSPNWCVKWAQTLQQFVVVGWSRLLLRGLLRSQERFLIKSRHIMIKHYNKEQPRLSIWQTLWKCKKAIFWLVVHWWCPKLRSAYHWCSQSPLTTHFYLRMLRIMAVIQYCYFREFGLSNHNDYVLNSCTSRKRKIRSTLKYID